MMYRWTKIFPLCLIEWYCCSRCEVWVDSHGKEYIRPFKDVRIYIDR